MTQSYGSKAEPSQDCQTADNSKTAKRRRHRVRHLKPHIMYGVKIDQPTETQNQGNLMTQSYGSKVTVIFCDQDCQAAEEHNFWDDHYGHPRII